MNRIEEYLDYLFPDPKCELIYESDYQLLIAIVLSAQSTDKRVNSVTPTLFKKYSSLEALGNGSLGDIESIIRPVGSYHKKASYIKDIALILNEKYNEIVPRDRDKLIELPGVGRKTANVFLSEFYGENHIAVDTHVERVCKRLGIVSNNATPRDVEYILKNEIPVDKWNRVSEQILLFGRYYCRAINPKCDNCLFKDFCKYKRN